MALTFVQLDGLGLSFEVEAISGKVGKEEADDGEGAGWLKLEPALTARVMGGIFGTRVEGGVEVRGRLPLVLQVARWLRGSTGKSIRG
jgi:hypothetical protein